jgi:serine/threonine protein kinase
VQDWNQGHSKACELLFDERIKEIEQRCPFLTDGVMLSQKETKDMLSTANNFFDNYLRTNVKGKTTAVLGSGSYGKVFYMQNKKTQKPVAVKVIEKKNVKDKVSLKSLVQEIEIHKRLLHDNIIRLIEHCEDQKNIYLVMEYAAKGSLFQFIRRNEKLNEKEAFYFFTQACNAVHFLHKHQLIHRDIKPENMLITVNGQLKLGDFGCCVSCDSSERKTFCGTIEYMAPEIIKRHGYKEKADVWSLGVLLYEMLHGYAPFQSNKDQETMRQIVEDKLEFHAAIKEDVKDLISRMLHSNPLKRPHIVELFDMKWVKRLQNEFNIKDRATKKEDSTEPKLSIEAPICSKSNIEENTIEEHNNSLYNVDEHNINNNEVDFKECNENEDNDFLEDAKKDVDENYIEEVKESVIKSNDNIEDNINELEEANKDVEECKESVKNEESNNDVIENNNKKVTVGSKEVTEGSEKIIEGSKETIEGSEEIIKGSEEVTERGDEITGRNEVLTEERKEEVVEEKVQCAEKEDEVHLLVDVSEAGDDTNASFTSDDYEQQRCESLMKLVYYLDDLDCEVEEEVLDRHVKSIEKDNKLLKKLVERHEGGILENQVITQLSLKENSINKAEINEQNVLKVANHITPIYNKRQQSWDKLLSFNSAM